jgi:hypothetical protein
VAVWILGNKDPTLFFWHVNAQNNNNARNQGYCYLKNKQIVQLQYDPVTGSYTQIIEEGENHENNDIRVRRQQHRFLHSSSTSRHPVILYPPPASSTSRYYYQDAIRVHNKNDHDEHHHHHLRRQMMEITNSIKQTNEDGSTNSNTAVVVSMRQCSCMRMNDQNAKYDYYCPLELEVCYIPRCGSSSNDCIRRK